MKTKITLIMAFVLYAGCLFAQEKTKSITETTYMLCKRGMNEKFEAAVKAHNDKFHKDPNSAALRSVVYGDKAGWYVWLMRGTYASLDNRPGKGAHDDDWSKNVDPLVEEYGQVGLFEFNEELSVNQDKLADDGYYNLWMIDLKRGKYNQFKSLVSRIGKAYEAMDGRAFLVFDNAVPSNNTPDIGLIWGFDKYAELNDNWGTKAAYENIYGEGSWEAMVDEWMSITESIDTEIRSMLK